MDVLYKYSPIYNPEKLNEEYSIINLLSNQATFSTRKNFNDPFDSKIDFIKPSRTELKNIHSQLKGKLKHEFKQFFIGIDGKDNIERFYEIANKKFDEYLFFCLTSKPDSNLMWSHYANSHKGFCLEWDASKLNAEKAIYQNNIASFELLDVIKNNFGLSLHTEKQSALNIWKALKVKLNEWKYEDEYRIQCGKGMEHLIIERNSKFALVSYEPEIIKSIIFGCRMDPKTIQYIDERLPERIVRKYAVAGKSKIVIKQKLI
ncbi:DUF2971 domain-containing protein [Pseudoalteromonas sp. B131b]|uniref:DUF2971 domain-containing protein n=1 Tax=Pseudoalteromonas sp. B131b TaxID=630493 RepID=UPI00301E4E4B